tara:strand:+ start:2376 stop:2552 length:177 start_codon:yes stop_codon:yes gene_type:complete
MIGIDLHAMTILFIVGTLTLLYAKYKGFDPFGIYTNDKLHYFILIALLMYMGFRLSFG